MPFLSQALVVYKCLCHGCSSNYIDKNEPNLYERAEEHAYPNKKNSKQNVTFKYLSTCSQYSQILDLLNVYKDETIFLLKIENWNVLLLKSQYELNRVNHHLTLPYITRKSFNLFQLFRSLPKFWYKFQL